MNHSVQPFSVLWKHFLLSLSVSAKLLWNMLCVFAACLSVWLCYLCLQLMCKDVFLIWMCFLKTRCLELSRPPYVLTRRHLSLSRCKGFAVTQLVSPHYANLTSGLTFTGNDEAWTKVNTHRALIISESQRSGHNLMKAAALRWGVSEPGKYQVCFHLNIRCWVRIRDCYSLFREDSIELLCKKSLWYRGNPFRL